MVPTTPPPPHWNDMTINNEKPSLFLVMELLSTFSLQQLILYRTNRALNHPNSELSMPGTDINVAPMISLFTPIEVMMITRDISSAICHLHSHRIAHRDIKPDNILFRVPSHIHHDTAMMNISLHGITAVLSDFGEAWDFFENDMDHMIMPYTSVYLLGGAPNYRAPELTTVRPMRRNPPLINYDKADIWSLGCVLLQMVSGLNTVVDPKTHIMQSATLPSTLLPSIGSLITGTVTLTPSVRLSCYDVYQRSSKLMSVLLDDNRVTYMATLSKLPSHIIVLVLEYE